MVLHLLLGASIIAASGDSLPFPAARCDTTAGSASAIVVPADSVLLRFAPPIQAAPSDGDTVRRRPRAVEMSDAYATRLHIHHLASYTLVPLFAVQMIAGNQLYQSGGNDPAWALTLHKAGAGGLATLFTVNTVTGVWNLWEARSRSEGRTARLIHGGLMLAADAGFTYAGVKLGPEATRSGAKRIEHRRLAYISISTALLGYATMLIANR
jgi:hypothetical protein